MAHYRKVDVRIWNDSRFRELSDDGQLAFLFLLTHPHLTAMGAMRATRAGLAEERRWGPARFTKAFAALTASGMVQFDAGASYLWVPNFLRYNAPESPNVVTSWKEAYALLPECALRRQMVLRAWTFLTAKSEGFKEAFRKAFSEDFPDAFAKSMRIQEQEHKQEQEEEPPNPPSETPPKPPPLVARRRLDVVHESAIGVDVTERMHRTYLDRLANLGVSDPDGTLRRWYHTTEQAWRGKPTGTAFKFWDARFEELATKKHDPWGRVPFTWRCKHCHELHEIARRDQFESFRCPSLDAVASVNGRPA